jgi:hypothetical protein
MAETTPPVDEPTPQAAPPETPPVEMEAQRGSDVDDVLLAAVRRIESEMASPATGYVEDEDDEDLEPPVAGAPKDPLQATQKAVGELAGMVRQEREERLAIQAWTEFISDATPTEKEIAKQLTAEVADAAEMQKLIGVIRDQASGVDKVRGSDRETLRKEVERDLARQYGIVLRDDLKPLGVPDEEAKAIENGDFQTAISSRIKRGLFGA